MDNKLGNPAILQQIFPKVFFHGCVCHVLNLLVEDIVQHIPWIDALD